jgi:hypothetical protein
MAVAAGSTFSLALRNDGTVVAWGDNTLGTAEEQAQLSGVKSIAAGGNHALATLFSTWVQYPVDVSKDLLLVYNSTSTNSIFVKDYYLAHRPMVSGANVLGIACPDRTSFFPEEYTNTLAAPVQSWLADNPTKRPQYVILFLGIPWRVSTNALYQYDWAPTSLRESVQYQLRAWCVPTWRPFVTAINMRDSDNNQPATNASVAYINKLMSIGSTNWRGDPTLSASAGGAYNNTNLVFDNVRYGYNWGWCTNGGCYPGAGGVMSNALVAVQAMNISGIGFTYVDGNEDGSLALSNQPPHITNAANVAGYMCWGQHSLLGGYYATDTNVVWQGDSGWYLIETVESWNGQPGIGVGDFYQWYSVGAFGGTDYSNTPVGAVTHVDEPGLPFINDPATYFGLWTAGKNFAICAWNSQRTWHFQAVGDPMLTR